MLKYACMEDLYAIILAAGKGERMGTEINKVTLPLAGESIIKRTIKILRNSGIKNIVVLVGYARESVHKELDQDIIIVDQKEQLGTGHAVQTALSGVPNHISDVLVLYGDNSYLLTKELLTELLKFHQKENAAITMLTSDSISPEGIGRIIRNDTGKITKLVEVKDAANEELKSKEINLGIYIFDSDFLRENLPLVEKSKVTGEYYLTDLIEIAISQNKKVVAILKKDIKWRGINTLEELKEAEKLING